MSTGRMLVVGGVVAGMAAAAPGWAAPAAPTPTASVATFAGGVRLPANTVAAGWSDVTPGCAGRLTASGPAVSGTTTVVNAAIASRWFRPRHGLLLSVGFDQGGDRVWRPMPERVGLQLRLRAKGHRWTPWWGLQMTTEPSSPPLPDLVVQFSTGGAMEFLEQPRAGHRLPLQQVQVRLGDRVTSTAQIDDEFTAAMGC